MFNIAEATTAALVAKYNELTGKSIKKFSSRAAGEKQVAAALAAGGAQQALEASPDNELVTADLAKAKAAAMPAEAPVQPTTAELAENHAAVVDAAPAKAGKAKKERVERVKKPKVEKMLMLPADRSAAIRRSWSNGAVYDARRERTKVSVTYANGTGHDTTEEFRSTKQAFEKLELPLGRHIPFRMTLKAQGVNSIEVEGIKYFFKTVKAD